MVVVGCPRDCHSICYDFFKFCSSVHAAVLPSSCRQRVHSARQLSTDGFKSLGSCGQMCAQCSTAVDRCVHGARQLSREGCMALGSPAAAGSFFDRWVHTARQLLGSCCKTLKIHNKSKTRSIHEFPTPKCLKYRPLQSYILKHRWIIR